MNRIKSVSYLTALTVLLVFCRCSKKNSDEEQRTFVRIEVDNKVYEYFDDKVKASHSFGSVGNTVGNLYDTSVVDLQGKPGFFISYSGPLGQKEGDFWITWGTWNIFSFGASSSPNSWITWSINDPNKRKFAVSQISSDNKSWAGDFYFEADNSLGEMKIIKGTYSIIGK